MPQKSCCETKNLPWFWKVNFVIRGLPWFLLGYYLHSPKAEAIKNMRSDKLWALAIIGFVIAVIPTAFDLPIKFTVIGYIPYAFGLFVLTLKNPGQSICRPMEYIGDCLSLYIYILHTLIGKTLNIILEKLKFDTNNMIYLWFKPIIAVLLSIFVSWIIYSFVKTRSKSSS